MTVKKLTQAQKEDICAYVRVGIRDSNTMATAFGVSRRTIIRAVEEAGLDPQIRRRKKSPPVQEVLTTLYPEKKLSWFQRQVDRLVRW